MATEDFDIDAELDAAGRELDKVTARKSPMLFSKFDNIPPQDAEIERILTCFKLNAYAVLDLLPGVPASDIKKTYRAKSLLIHPDKTSNPRAPDAFDRLKKAQTVLSDDKLRAELEEHIADARMLVMRERKLKAEDAETRGADFARAWREKTTWVIMDEERRKARQREGQMREEGRAQRKEEEELKERKRKREIDDAWEKTREDRVSNWRDFQKSKAPMEAGGKKKKKKMKIVG